MIALAEVLGFLLLPWFCIAHAWKTAPAQSIKPWPSGTPGSGPFRSVIDCWSWDWLNAWYSNVEDGVSGQQAYVWHNDALVLYPSLFAPWVPAWCIAFAWSAWRNGANNLKRPLRHDTF